MSEMLVVVGLVLWVGIGAALGLVATSEAFAEGWSEASTQDQEAVQKKGVADDHEDRRPLVAGTVAAVVAGAISMVAITGESVVGLMVSIPVAGIGAAVVLVIVSAMKLVPNDESGQDRNQTPFDQ
ncbi:hypothetical protein [Rhodococcoides fascians]|uniref:hypothetical protein n=1 Tax=Rhodococcoides fascians TaxID=1828 RepID=UPI000A488F8F|nr:hypothetical protein [Rhodococcus fascians]